MNARHDHVYEVAGVTAVGSGEVSADWGGLEARFKPLIELMEEVLRGTVSMIMVTTSYAATPCMLNPWDPHVLQVYLRHPLMAELKKKFDDSDKSVEVLIRRMFDAHCAPGSSSDGKP